jgi:hypothetical protein
MNPIPIEPSLKTGFLRAIFIGVAAGLGVGLLRDRIDHVFHNPDEIKADLNLPLLGHKPQQAITPRMNPITSIKMSNQIINDFSIKKPFAIFSLQSGF